MIVVTARSAEPKHAVRIERTRERVHNWDLKPGELAVEELFARQVECYFL